MKDIDNEWNILREEFIDLMQASAQYKETYNKLKYVIAYLL